MGTQAGEVMDRRTFFKAVLGAGGAAVAGLLGIPGVATILAPVLRRPRGAVWAPVGRLDAFPAGEVRPTVIEVPRDDWDEGLRRRAVYVSRLDPHEVVVFSRSCTDLSCPVMWDAGSGWFLCPCHGGIFSSDGQPQKGPPSRPLYRYATRVRAGTLEVDLRSVPPMV
ncbi:MAG: Rieske 2Fe-2S domain-containing protein [Planctomycetota bacterium]|nr:Rieske 2Fe-2S domain-containing protein [Planctomycetota bacterium]